MSSLPLSEVSLQILFNVRQSKPDIIAESDFCMLQSAKSASYIDLIDGH
jgi:hypothetical protein